MKFDAVPSVNALSKPGMSAVRQRRVSVCPDEPSAAGLPAVG